MANLDDKGMAARREVLHAVFVGPHKLRSKLDAYFVRCLLDTGADGRSDIAVTGAQCAHGGQRLFEHATECAAPTSMRRTHDACMRIDEQNGGAVGTGDTQRHTGACRDQRIGLWASARCCAVDPPHNDAVGLFERDQALPRKVEMARDAREVFLNPLGVVL